jgi:hypothetical protein
VDDPPADSQDTGAVLTDLHGAVPDDGIDDAAGIQAALDEASGVVRLPSGTFTVSEPLKLPPGVLLTGAGPHETVLQRMPDAWAAFGYGFLVTPSAPPLATDAPTGLADLTLDGYRSAGGGAENQGGGVKVADHWVVSNVHFQDFNYFKLWIKDTTGVVARACTFGDVEGAPSSGNDNVGGGSNTDLVLEDLVVELLSDGNAVDLLNSTGLVLRGMRAERGSVYLEGTVDGVVTDNELNAGAIVLQTDVGYSSSSRVRNPSGNLVARNTVENADRIGIAVRYDDDQGHGLPIDPGGGNVVSDNTIRRPGRLGVAVFGADEAAKTTPDHIENNVVEDVLSPAPYTYNTGYGTFDDAGIGLSIGTADVITGNLVRDTQTSPTTRLGITLGASGAPTTPYDTVVSANVNEGF